MSDKIFSISKAVREMLSKGILTGFERECHFTLEREAESPGDHKWLRTSNARDQALHVPIELFTTRQLTTAGFPIGTWTEGISNLLTWSSCLRAGATVLTGLSRNASLWQIGQLPVPDWLAELGQVTPSDPLFASYPVSPKRISGLINISTQLLKQQTGPELDRILISDISRQLASYLDQVALYGGGPSANQPTGLINVSGVAQGVAIDPTNPHGSFSALEEQIENANVSMDSYGILVSPATKKILRITPSFANGSLTTWSELRNPQSSPEITDGRCFAGAWQCSPIVYGVGVSKC